MIPLGPLSNSNFKNQRFLNKMNVMFCSSVQKEDFCGIGIVIDTLEKEIKLGVKYKCSKIEGDYKALLLGIKEAEKLKIDSLAIFSDSEYIVNQFKNSMKSGWKLEWIPKENNYRAVKEAIKS
mgnify:CR=1 FL=1